MPLLEWGDAEEADQAELQNFVCTPDRVPSDTRLGQLVYPKPPEARAQSLIRGLRIAKARRCDQRIWVGRDELGIGAVLSWKWIEPGLAMVHVVGLASRLRGNGRACTDEMVESASVELGGEAAERGYSEVELTAWIHVGNRPSKAFAARFEMAAVTEPDEDGYVLFGTTWAFAETEAQ